MRFPNNSTCCGTATSVANTNFCGCGNDYPIVPGTNPALQTWNGQAFVVADGSAQNRISLPFLQVNGGAATYVVGADNNGVWSYYSPNLSPNLAGGAAGQVPWQISTNVTGFTTTGTSGQLLQSGGTNSPTWIAPNNLLVTATGSTTPRTLQARFADVVNVKDFGAVGDGVTDDTAAIQAAIDSFEVIFIPKGVYKISSLLNSPSGRITYIYGEGAGVSILKQTNLSLGGIKFNLAYAQGGGVSGITITSDVAAQSTGSNGIGLQVVNANDNFTVSNIDITSFNKGIRVDGCFYPKFENFRIVYFTDYGIYISPYSGFGTDGAGSSWRNGKVSNFGFSGNATASIGIYLQQSSGEFFDTIDVTSCNVGVKLYPTNGSFVRYLFMSKILGDTCNTNWIIDATLGGTIVANQFFQCWSSNSQGDGVIFQGTNIDCQKWVGGWIRDSRNNGVQIQGGSNVSFLGTEITRNSASLANTYDGIFVSPNVSSFSIVGCRIGNVSTTVGFGIQRYNINISAGTSNGYTISDNDLNDSGTYPINNLSSGTQFCINNNLPIATSGTNTSSKLSTAFASSSPIASSSTVYFGCLGTSTNVFSSPFYQTKLGFVSDLWVACDVAPGIGQSFTYTIYKNGNPTTMTVSISGVSFLGYTTTNPVSFSNSDAITIQLVTSSAAATAGHRGYFSKEN